ncbi:MAG: hypothetical protein E5Y01_17460 [Mesorhizobium sp.]|nr:MAG: hypothetical protein EOR74_29045 [Mesorhizobium sp.]RWM37258.1 MAG: hypothetical protein EOR75_20305 [Mesorhizobium sp.]TJV50858.1 MAG: hypothetical protein E5Y01_17460 [Mesorhizobium sp.]
MRGAPAWRRPFSSQDTRRGSPAPHFFQHPSIVSALRADPPSPTRGEGEAATTVRLPRTCCRSI